MSSISGNPTMQQMLAMARRKYRNAISPEREQSRRLKDFVRPNLFPWREGHSNAVIEFRPTRPRPFATQTLPQGNGWGVPLVQRGGSCRSGKIAWIWTRTKVAADPLDIPRFTSGVPKRQSQPACSVPLNNLRPWLHAAEKRPFSRPPLACKTLAILRDLKQAREDSRARSPEPKDTRWPTLLIPPSINKRQSPLRKRLRDSSRDSEDAPEAQPPPSKHCHLAVKSSRLALGQKRKRRCERHWSGHCDGVQCKDAVEHGAKRSRLMSRSAEPVDIPVRLAPAATAPEEHAAQAVVSEFSDGKDDPAGSDDPGSSSWIWMSNCEQLVPRSTASTASGEVCEESTGEGKDTTENGFPIPTSREVEPTLPSPATVLRPASNCEKDSEEDDGIVEQATLSTKGPLPGSPEVETKCIAALPPPVTEPPQRDDSVDWDLAKLAPDVPPPTPEATPIPNAPPRPAPRDAACVSRTTHPSSPSRDTAMPPWRGRRPVPAWFNSGESRRSGPPATESPHGHADGGGSEAGMPPWRNRRPVPAWVSARERENHGNNGNMPPWRNRRPVPACMSARERGNDDDMPPWRNRRPVPAWKGAKRRDTDS